MDLHNTLFTGEDELSSDELIDANKYHIYLFMYEGKFSGYVIMTSFSETAWNIEYLALCPQYRGNGLGGKLVSLVLHQFGDRTITLECKKKLIPFYSKYGANLSDLKPRNYGNEEHYFMFFTDKYINMAKQQDMLKQLLSFQIKMM